MADFWFRQTHNFWFPEPMTIEGWGTIIVALLCWILAGIGLDVLNPTFFKVISFVLAGVFCYLIVVFVAYHTSEKSRW